MKRDWGPQTGPWQFETAKRSKFGRSPVDTPGILQHEPYCFNLGLDLAPVQSDLLAQRHTEAGDEPECECSKQRRPNALCPNARIFSDSGLIESNIVCTLRAKRFFIVSHSQDPCPAILYLSGRTLAASFGQASDRGLLASSYAQVSRRTNRTIFQATPGYDDFILGGASAPRPCFSG